jgi:hypothetical protein
MAFVVAKPRSNNLEERRPSKKIFTSENSNLDLYVYFISLASLSRHHGSFNLEDDEFSHLMFSSCSFTMFCSSRVLLMNSLVCFGFGEI